MADHWQRAVSKGMIKQAIAAARQTLFVAAEWTETADKPTYRVVRLTSGKVTTLNHTSETGAKDFLYRQRLAEALHYIYRECMITDKVRMLHLLEGVDACPADLHLYEAVNWCIARFHKNH